MSNLIPYVQLGAALLLIVLVILQRSGGDVGGAFGGGDGAEFFRTRRGFEKFLFFATILIALVFVATSAWVLILK